MVKKALTIAGSDSGGGAGIQADLKTFMAFGVYGMSAITAITAQNTIGVQAAFELPLELIAKQIESIATDIGVDAVKTGMLSSAGVVEIVAAAIEKFQLPNVVVDPVMVAKSGDPLLSEDARLTMKHRLLPLATVITPNLFEAQALLGMEIKTLDEMQEAARMLYQTGAKWVVVKGGHLTNQKEAIDVVFNGQRVEFLRAPFIHSRNTHGTGCTFSSAIAAGLAKGYDPLEAIQRAKAYTTEAIKMGLPLGKGHGPTNHLVGVKSSW